MAGHGETSAPEVLHCYRHPDRETLISCSNCERPICTSCMTQAAVGVRCPECAGTRGSRRPDRLQPQRQIRLGTPGTATATMVIVAINLLVYLGEVAQSGSLWDASDSRLALDYGIYGPAIADGEWYRLVTGGFLHATPVHVGFNMYLAWILGGALERYAGTGRLLAVYFTALLWGSAGAVLVTPDSLTVGASGAVFGLMAALFLLERQRGVALLGSTVGMLLLLNLVITFLIPGISVGGHIGGIVGGAAAAFVLSGYGKGHMAYGRMGVQGWAAIAALIVAALAVGVVSA